MKKSNKSFEEIINEITADGTLTIDEIKEEYEFCRFYQASSKESERDTSSLENFVKDVYQKDFSN